MYLDYWHFDHSPFPHALEPARFYASPTHYEALARIDHLVSARRRMGLVMGESGLGKSFVLRMASHRLSRAGCQVASVNAVGVGMREFLAEVATGIGAPSPQGEDVMRLWRRITDRVYENRLQQTSSVLLVDDAGQARPDILPQLMRLARIDADPQARWTIILTSLPRQLGAWSNELLQLVDLRMDLAPWEETDTVGYVQTALVEAGLETPIFEPEALSLLHDLSSGVPRQVARLADAALVAGAAARRQTIDASTIRAVENEFGWLPAASGRS